MNTQFRFRVVEQDGGFIKMTIIKGVTPYIGPEREQALRWKSKA